MPDSAKPSRRISSKNLSNLKVVVLCILAATTFWILNALNKDNYTTIVDYPIQWEFDRVNYMPVKQLPQSIQIQISGDGWDLLRKYFNINEPAFSIVVPEPSAKNYILTAELKRPLGEFITPTKLEGLLGDTLHYRIDKIVSRKFIPYLDSADYSLAKNIEIDGRVNFTPNKIGLKGPSSLLDSLGGKFPVRINEKNINASYSKIVPLNLNGELNNLIQLEETEVEVSFSIIRYLEGNKRLKVKKLYFPRQVRVQGEEIVPMLTYLIDEKMVDELKDMEFEAILDYRKRNRQDSTITFTVSPKPAFLKDLKIEPSLVKLKYD